MNKGSLKILIAAGGTGGHILPGIEVAKKIHKIAASSQRNIEIEFVGVGRPIEKEILSKEAFRHHVLPGMGLKGKGIAGIRDFFKIAPAARKAAKNLINDFKPNVVAGFGGYPSVLPILVANFSRIPTWIHEADSSAGWATKFLSLFATKISCAYPEIDLPFCRKVIYSGHPVRPDIFPAVAPAEDYIPKNVLILGGSQGAKSLDVALPAVVSRLNNSDLNIRHQSRNERVAEVQAAYRLTGVSSEVSSYIREISNALNQADLIISRAGAGAVTELSILNKPVIFVPLPNVSGHQLKNAKLLERGGKALIVEEGDQFEERLLNAMNQLLDPKAYREMMLRPFLDRKIQAAETIAEGIVELADS